MSMWTLYMYALWFLLTYGYKGIQSPTTSDEFEAHSQMDIKPVLIAKKTEIGTD